VTLPNHFSGDLSDLLAPDELAAVYLMRDRFGIDSVRTYQFWEHMAGLLLDGDLTPAGHPYDVMTRGIRVEVKYAQEFTCQYRQGRRQVLKWTDIRREASDVTVLFGVEDDDSLYAWVAPSLALGRTITLTSPHARVGNGRSVLDRWHVPFDQVLPAVLRCYDRKPVAV
jgi:hypothetical protein